MFVVRILERKNVIQLFGAGLMLSPFVNIFIKILVLTEVRERWTLSFAWKVFESNPVPNKILFVSSLIIGAVMIRGASTAWKFVLVFMACQIANQLMNFGPGVRASKLFAVFFVINVAIFLFIADQLVWKVKAATPKHKKLVPLDHKAEKDVLIHFEGFGPWAKLTSVSNRGIHIRGIETLPFELNHREIEVKIKDDLILRTRLARCLDEDYFFEYIRLTPAEVDKLNQWLRSQVQAA
jgi:hypothetical protein